LSSTFSTQSGSRSAWQSAFYRITGKHIDFLICDRATITVLAAIELDDKSHRATLNAGFRDAFVDSALAGAAIPLLRIPARQAYSPSELRDQIMAVMQPSRNHTRGAVNTAVAN
jgi:hypothetical protein